MRSFETKPKKPTVLLPVAVLGSALCVSVCLLGLRSDTLAWRGVVESSHQLDVEQLSAAIRSLSL